jgi:hypothetical protein
MFAALRRVARRVVRSVAREERRDVRLLKRKPQADAYGRVHAVTIRTVALPAAVRFLSAPEVEASDGVLRNADCVLTVASGVTVDVTNDLVSIDGAPYRVLKIVPDAAGALQEWNCRRVR